MKSAPIATKTRAKLEASPEVIPPACVALGMVLALALVLDARVRVADAETAVSDYLLNSHLEGKLTTYNV